MSEKLCKSVRLSATTKLVLDNLRGTQTCNEFLSDLFASYEVGNLDQKRSMRNLLENLQKRQEDLIKIVKCQERDIFRPVMTLVKEGAISSADNTEAVLLANENNRLKKEMADLKKSKKDGEEEEYRAKLLELSELIITQCDPENFNTVTLGSDLKVPPSFFNKLIKLVKEKYVL